MIAREVTEAITYGMSGLDYYSYWKKQEDRMQDYSHWDYSLGLNYAFNEGSRLGLYAGLVTGDVVQEMDKDDESVSRSGERGTSRWSDYQSWHTTDQQWDHSLVDEKIRSTQYWLNVKFRP